jgi:hypothetical protein
MNLDISSKKSLDEVEKMKSWTTTETVRKSLSIAHYLLKEIAAGRRVVTVDRNGENPRDVIFL